LPYVLEISCKGLDSASRVNPTLAQGINIRRGKVTNRAVAETFGLEYTALSGFN
jgi:alanine dehydrogenase